MPEDSELKPLTPDEMEKKISEVNSKLNIDDTLQSGERSSNIATVTNKNENMSAKDTYTMFSWLFMIASIGFSIYGVYTLYNNNYSARIVGGDAYNYIIYATRGTAWVCVGIVSAIIGLTLAVFANTSNNSR